MIGTTVLGLDYGIVYDNFGSNFIVLNYKHWFNREVEIQSKGNNPVREFM